MKRKLIGLLIVLSLITFKSFSEVPVCFVWCYLTDDFRPTTPTTGCHIQSPQSPEEHYLVGTSFWTDGSPCYVNWKFQLYISPWDSVGSEDCTIHGCHLHNRVLDPSSNYMLYTIGGMKNYLENNFSDHFEEDNVFVSVGVVAHPEVSGEIMTILKASIPPNADRSMIPILNPDWQFDHDDPQNWMFTVVTDSYIIKNLVILPDTDYYIKDSDPGPHTAGHQFFAKSEMIEKLQAVAKQIREDYKEENNYKVKIRFNDLSLEYGGLFDVEGDWDCHPTDPAGGHNDHRLGTSADLGSSPCLMCDDGQQGCTNKNSLNKIKVKKDGVEILETVKEWIDKVAEENGLTEYHSSGNLIHLEMK
jgi:hypothetical protein